MTGKRKTRPRRPLRIALTGGIASGKSTVARLFMALGARLIDTDQVARDIVVPPSPVLERIVARVALYDLATDQVSWLDGASLDSAGQGVLMVVPCFDGEQCVASETTDETSNAVLVPCRDRAACDQFLRHLDFLAEEAFWLAF